MPPARTVGISLSTGRSCKDDTKSHGSSSMYISHWRVRSQPFSPVIQNSASMPAMHAQMHVKSMRTNIRPAKIAWRVAEPV